MNDATILPACCTPSPGATLAERLYCAYNAGGAPATAGLSYAGAPCPTWADLPENVRAKWIATGGFVGDSVLPVPGDLGWALRRVQMGFPVRREAWPAGDFVSLTPGNPAVPTASLWSPANRAYAEARGGTVEVLPSITWCTGGAIVMGWTPTAIDLLAEDWTIAPA